MNQHGLSMCGDDRGHDVGALLPEGHEVESALSQLTDPAKSPLSLSRGHTPSIINESAPETQISGMECAPALPSTSPRSDRGATSQQLAELSPGSIFEPVQESLNGALVHTQQRRDHVHGRVPSGGTTSRVRVDAVPAR